MSFGFSEFLSQKIKAVRAIWEIAHVYLSPQCVFTYTQYIKSTYNTCTHTLNCTTVYILKVHTTHTIHINTHKKQKEKTEEQLHKKEEPFCILVILNFIFCFTRKYNFLIFK